MLPTTGADDAEAIDAALDTRVPNVSRMYNRWLGGQDNFSADRTAADTLSADFPEIAHVARANRLFVLRAVRHVAAQGISQYLDIGAGMPTRPAVHEAARAEQPAAKVVYVDRDPVVLAESRARLAGVAGVAVVPGDIGQPQQILGHPDLRAVLDLDRPVCLLLTAVLHFVVPAEADAAVAAFTAAMAPGSYLILSSGTTTGTSPMIVASLAAAYQGHTTVTGRTATEIGGYFAGLDLEPPGIVDVWAWRPDSAEDWPPAAAARILGGVAHKPVSRAGWTPPPEAR
jgi:O-methyltransferase involved in polyketide biosynthesis